MLRKYKYYRVSIFKYWSSNLSFRKKLFNMQLNSFLLNDTNEILKLKISWLLRNFS